MSGVINAPAVKTASRLSARDLVLAFFHAASDRSLDVATLVMATGMLGLKGNATRVALSRLLQEGWVERDERGRYRLRAERAAAAGGLSSYNRVKSAVRRWNGRFLGCVVDPERTPDTFLRLGFRSPASGLSVRPDNLAGGIDLLEGRIGTGRLFVITPAGSTDATASWRSLWDCDALTDGYARMRARIRKSRSRLRGLSAEKALGENFDVARSSIAGLEADPLLPAEWVDAASRDALVDELTAYDREARALWMKTLPGLQLEVSVRANSPWTPRSEDERRTS